jgi:replication-associated recombination protein RarA
MNIEEKYEPRRFAELVFADIAARDTCNRYATSKPYKPLMLWGPPGTAKTTTARVIVRERFLASGYDGHIEEFNGADIDASHFKKFLNVANLLKLNSTSPILIINEFDEIDKDDQKKFRSWMDTWKWIDLIVTTNEKPGIQGVRQKLIPALISRFERVELASPSLSDWLPRAQEIFAAEGHQVTQQELQQLLGTFDGDARDMLPLIEEALDGLSPSTPPSPSKPSLRVVSSQAK